MIESGVILVNGQVCTVFGTLVGPDDKVQFGGQTLNAEKKVYLLMNKPKGYITTADDPQERKTVMELVRDACRERIYPVGRLDRNTTGVLLFTNDGDVAKNLTHPSHGARKIYHVTLDNPLAKADLTAIAKGVMLEDGLTEVGSLFILVTKVEPIVEIINRTTFATLSRSLPQGRGTYCPHCRTLIIRQNHDYQTTGDLSHD